MDQIPPHFHKDYRIDERDLLPNPDVLTALPVSAEEGARCVVENGGSYTFYRYLRGSWRQVGGMTPPLSVPNGGTGQTSLGANLVLLGNGTNGITTVTVGANGHVLTQTGSGPAFQSIPNSTAIEVPITCGEDLLTGEVVRLYIATGSYVNDGYQMVNGNIYACRAAANNTTYGTGILGIASQDAYYLGSGKVFLAGKATGFTGLSGVAAYYLDNCGFRRRKSFIPS